MRSFAVRAVLITLLTLLLFFIAVFVIIIPAFERSILDQKRDMIRELTNSAWNILAKFQNDAKTGVLSETEAQKQAIAQIRNLHYGQQMKDYFWINDMHPRMVAHPYRADLDGKDLTEFSDPQGTKLFVEVVKTVKAHGAGYVNYKWQWKDDSTRIVPKMSYVKGFEPWGWVIGTGVYVDDVQQEISDAKLRLVVLSLAILLINTILLSYFLWESLLTERKRKLAEKALQNSEEKYRTLVESSGECLIMQVGNDALYANQSMLTLIGCGMEALSQLKPEDILEPTAEEKEQGRPFYRGLLQGEPIPQKYETRLKKADGSWKDVTVSLSRISIQDKLGFIAVATDISRRRERELVQERFLSEMQSALVFLNQPVKDLARKNLILARPTDTPEAILATLPRGEGFPILVTDAEGKPRQLITASDLLAFSRDCPDPLKRPFESVPGQDPVCISGEALAFEAFWEMEKNRFRPLLITNAKASPMGILTVQHLAQIQKYSPTLLLKEIEKASTKDDLIRTNRRFFDLVCILVKCGIRPVFINRIMAQNGDMVVKKAVQLVFNELGNPPVDFVFMLLGSGGRFEQTLRTDQDNAIIYKDVPPDREPAVREYFSRLGHDVCELLAATGYALCDGQIMANNPKWCQPLKRWKSYFSEWINTMEAEDLLQAKIFFDFRAVAGNTLFIEQLRESLVDALQQNPRFFFLLARNVLIFQPPLGLFGNFVFDPDVPDRQVFNIKGVMALIVDFARIYALKHGIAETNTLERLRALVQKGVLNEQSFAEMEQAYGFLMKMRIENQVTGIQSGREVDNYIEPHLLSSMDQKIVKEVFAQIKHFQVKLSYDFTGGMAQQV